MEPIISSNTKMCRICPNILNLTDLSLPENDYIIKNLEILVPVEIELSEQLPKYICDDCNSALQSALQFKSKISERIDEIKTLIEISMKPIKSEIVFDIEEVIINPLFEEGTIKSEIPEKPPSAKRKPPKTNMTKTFNRSCLICQKRLNSYKEMVDHHKTHKDCNLCDKKYHNFDRLRQHYKIVHLKVPDEKYACEICGREFQRKKNIIIHIRSFHNNERNYSCDICGRTFFGKTEMEKHRVLHSDERPFICDICEKGFKSNLGLQGHQKTHEETKTIKKKTVKTFICTFCGKQVLHHAGFKQHMLIHTNELPFECEVCNQKFRAKTSLTSHKRIHTGEKPYKCDLCPASFRMQHYLTTHKLSHGGNNVKKYECNLCGMSTVYEKNLETHMKTVHMQIKNFDCKTCSESFTKISLLKTHMLESHNLMT